MKTIRHTQKKHLYWFAISWSNYDKWTQKKNVKLFKEAQPLRLKKNKEAKNDMPNSLKQFSVWEKIESEEDSKYFSIVGTKIH